MLRLLKLLFKIVLLPFVVVFTIALAVVTKIYAFFAGLAIMLSGVFFLYSIYCYFDPVYNWSALPALLFALFLSPIGAPLIGTVVIIYAENFRDWLKAI